MFSLTVIVGTNGWGLMFRSKGKAEAAVATLEGGVLAVERVSIVDDFGQSLFVNRDNISGWVFEDMEQSKLAHVERALAHARMQGLVQKMAEADPALRTSMMNRGPAIVSPMGFNGRG